MVILSKYDAFVLCFIQYGDGPNRFELAWGRTRDARKPTPKTWINSAAPGRWRYIFTLFRSEHFCGTKTMLKMSPNMVCEALPSYSPKSTVAKRKEALELRKVSAVAEFLRILLNIFANVFEITL